mmetsp:Transcript_44092/g.86218  ORF Transcript_44092/g.86218 Transcript_44092/m.86218 type:complete len:197 (+) Transcript_44092:28-618(+)|eukprot:CAMPEP_0175153228 /NCGR_PEP_ID=MMETSP0087-20121206/19605_1 /TAXON_ID=136419 /ORGANISM="Unknown Unknown, Strain D1" /LENGTH=196 /DNA_ID=CAMNT_0016439853 /DNA_START=27 /DNA_END=617 /DNA_ORIENTATION=+
MSHHDEHHHGHAALESFKDGTLDFCDDPKTCCMSFLAPYHLFAKNMAALDIMNYGTALVLYLIPWLGLLALYMVFIPTAAGLEVDNDGQIIRGSFLQEYKTFCEVFLVFGLVGFSVLIVIASYFRGQLRHKLHIQGSGCEDCCCHALCCICSIAQETREVSNWEAEEKFVHDVEKSATKPLIKPKSKTLKSRETFH